jgi:GH35 family endo-1,4-beta-xylanase
LSCSCVSHYRGQVNIWDVVNEAIDNSGQLRDSFWLHALGSSYLDLAFRWAYEANPLAAQARVYASMLHACSSVRACTAFVMWGFTDRYSWIPQVTGRLDTPLIFDENYHPKPAYDALTAAFKETSLPVAMSLSMSASGFTNSVSLSQ